MLKFKGITQSVDSYLELDEKIVDLKYIKDDISGSDGK